jgi:hypothetical protein
MRKNMKIMIIGNGFDLNLGLKTSYADFISSNFFKSLLSEDNSLAVYLAKQNELNNWVDIEQEITKYSTSTQVQAKDTEVENDFEALKTALMAYLREAQEGEINHESNAFQMIKNEITTIYAIYNFNYTNSVFRVAKMLNFDDIVANKHFYVHGSIENSDIIFGIEDTANIHPNHIFFKKSYNINFGKSKINNALNTDVNHSLIVFGHSLGITDSSYFKKYIKLLTFENKSTELKFYYYGKAGYDEMMKILDVYTQKNLSDFIHNNNLIRIDSSENN